MNRHEFYDNLHKYKSIQHGNDYGNGYYEKVDNFYGYGKPRYFYSKAEWDAYLEGKARDNAKRQDLVDKAKIHNQQVSNYENAKKAEQEYEKSKYEKPAEVKKETPKTETYASEQNKYESEDRNKYEAELKKNKEQKEEQKKDIKKYQIKMI